MINRTILFILFASFFSLSQCQTFLQRDPLDVAGKMAESVMKRAPSAWMTDFVKKPKWEYTQGLVCKAFEQLWLQTGNQKYFDYEKGYADTLISKDGVIKNYRKEEYNIDQVNSGRILFELYAKTNDQRYKRVLDTLRSQLNTHPRTSEGGFWHKKIYPNQMWLDGIYMGSPFLAQYGKVFNDETAFDDVANQILTIQKHTYDPVTGLNYHGWDESRQQKWADPQTGHSPNFWGRAMGWYCMGIADVLDYLPKNHAKRDSLVLIFRNAVTAMLRVQDKETGLWFQVLNEGQRPGNYPEATVSCMMAYSILKGVRMGYLDQSYKSKGERAYNGILRHQIQENADGTISLTHCCSVAGLGGNPYRDGSFEYYIKEPVRDNDPKGVGPFIMASVEMHLSINSK